MQFCGYLLAYIPYCWVMSVELGIRIAETKPLFGNMTIYVKFPEFASVNKELTELGLL